MIYKYYPPNKLSLDALENEYFWCSKRKYLNDPMDTYGEIINKYPVLLEELERRNINTLEYHKVLDLFGICCFTKSGLSNYFWTDYAEDYQGWALEYNDTNLEDKLFGITSGTLFKNVSYFNSWPDLNDLNTRISIEKGVTTPIRALLQTEKQADKLFRGLILMKEKDKWEIEDEIRIVLGRNFPGYMQDYKELDESKKVKGYKLNWPSKILKSIIVGHNIDIKNLEQIKLIARCKNVPLFMTKIVDSGVKFEITTEEIELN